MAKLISKYHKLVLHIYTKGDKSIKIIVIAGTAEATSIIDKLLDMNINVLATVTTRLGMESIHNRKGLHIYQGRLTQKNLESLIAEEMPDGLIDASNPFAKDISKNVLKISIKCNLPYLHYERKEIKSQGKDIIRVKTYDQAVEKLIEHKGNIMLTVGSSKIEMFTKIPNFKKRIFLRVLPDVKIISRCEKLGFNPGNIIAIKGPFTEELNVQLIKYCNASIMVTKESGNTGGTIEKISAARTLNIPTLMIERQEFTCENKTDSLEGVIKYIEKIIGLNAI
ncbi:precorrin-6A reductase [Alkalibaculum bacchi]|uniref:precorrin-6A reductase n=1 Tax=Alkalibaculum bacchi TaxID=645887 RepID=UPI0026F1F872|nr:precorrin-6A reductase [Alkalibaculum bacchi]